MHRPKIQIQKRKILDDLGHFRYYRVGMFSLDHKDSRYPYLNVETEKQLMAFIYNHYGAGDYNINGFVKGHRGVWTFWIGTIDENGWEFQSRTQMNSELRRLNKDLKEAIDSGDEEMINGIKEDIQFQKEQQIKDRRGKKYGFAPYLRSSGKKGTFHMWEEPDIAYNEKPSEEDIYG